MDLEDSIASRPGSSRAATSRYAGPALLLVSFAAIAVSAVLGPSATEAPLGPHDRRSTPPWHLDAAPPAWLVSVLLVVAVVAAAAALWLGLSGRWQPNARRLVAGGILATAVLAVLPPIGSADPLSYAAYGRMVVTHHNPWNTTPEQLAAHDPVENAVETPWRDTPSVYGPLATGEQAAASKLAGTDVAETILLLDLAGGAVFVAAGLLLRRLARDDVGRRRAALLWSANPLLWLQLVAGAHLDVISAATVLIAIAVAARSRFAAGGATGLATAVKAPAGLVWVALLWAARRSRAAVAALAVGFVVVAGAAYAVGGVPAARQLNRASRQVSLASPWRPVANLTDPAFGHGVSRHLIGGLAVILLAAVIVALHQINHEVRTGSPAALALAFSLAYVLSAPYALPWYDALPWVLIPLLAASRLDALLVAHTAVLSLAYIPGRAAYQLHGAMHTVAFGMRDVVSPILLIGLLAVVAYLAWTHAQRPARLE